MARDIIVLFRGGIRPPWSAFVLLVLLAGCGFIPTTLAAVSELRVAEGFAALLLVFWVASATTVSTAVRWLWSRVAGSSQINN